MLENVAEKSLIQNKIDSTSGIKDFGSSLLTLSMIGVALLKASLNFVTILHKLPLNSLNLEHREILLQSAHNMNRYQ